MQTTSIIRNAILFCGISASCFATSLVQTLDSSATETKNNSGSATVNVPVNSGWGTALSGSNWISYAQTGNPNGAGYVQVANGTTVLFTDNFQISGMPTSGSLLVMADDTTSVTLNGFTLASLGRCGSNTISYAASTSIDLTNFLHTGSNTLSFLVKQTAGGAYGLDYSASIASAATCGTPEPGTLALFGLPLVALAMLRRKRTA